MYDYRVVLGFNQSKTEYVYYSIYFNLLHLMFQLCISVTKMA